MSEFLTKAILFLVELLPLGFLDWLKALRRQIGIPDKLSELGIKSHEPMIEVAWNDPCHQSNPRSPTKEDFVKIYREAI